LLIVGVCELFLHVVEPFYFVRCVGSLKSPAAGVWVGWLGIAN
jgi:hypothetical protein